eukprot:3337959-Rhodomonas_salina.1
MPTRRLVLSARVAPYWVRAGGVPELRSGPGSTIQQLSTAQPRQYHTAAQYRQQNSTAAQCIAAQGEMKHKTRVPGTDCTQTTLIPVCHVPVSRHRHTVFSPGVP